MLAAAFLSAIALLPGVLTDTVTEVKQQTPLPILLPDNFYSDFDPVYPSGTGSKQEYSIGLAGAPGRRIEHERPTGQRVGRWTDVGAAQLEAWRRALECRAVLRSSDHVEQRLPAHHRQCRQRSQAIEHLAEAAGVAGRVGTVADQVTRSFYHAQDEGAEKI